MWISEDIVNKAKIRLIIGDEMAIYQPSQLEHTEDGYYVLTAAVAAAQMNDAIVVMIMNGNTVGFSETYSIRQYCETILADSQYSKYHTIVKEMLNYGAMAQIYFDYDTEYLANEGITGVANAKIPGSSDKMNIRSSIPGLDFYGASLIYRDRIAVRYYFTGDITGCTFTANGNTYAPVAKDGMYYIEIADILPQNLDQQIALVVTHTDGSMISAAYSPMNYIVHMNTKGSEKLQNLLKALYNYHLAAKQLNKTAV